MTLELDYFLMVLAPYSLPLNIASPSAYPLPKPKPTPIHTGKALLLKNKIDANTPPPKPKPVLISPLEKTTSHLSFNKLCDGVETFCSIDILKV